jgi:hypothetical protein
MKIIKNVRQKLKKETLEIGESTLIRDILYIFQGIDGSYLKFELEDEKYVFDTEVNLYNLI